MPLIAIPPGQERLLRAMLCDECDLPIGWSFESAAVVRSRVRARYRRADAAVVISLEHPDSAGAEGRRTGNFTIRVESAPDGLDPAPILDALYTSVGRLDSAWRWVAADDPTDGTVDVELTALLAGAKPLIRMTVAPGEAASMVARYREAGAQVAALGRSAVVGGREQAVIYAARTSAEANQLRDLESEFFALQQRSADDDTSRRYHLRIGEMLGYPACCVEAFCEIQRTIEGVDDTFRGARAAWTARPFSRLNNLLRVESASLISFAPCSYECLAAQTVANEIADAVAAISASVLRRLDEQLARPLLVSATGLRAEVELQRTAAPSIATATALSRRRDASPDPADITLARQLAGAPVDATGTVQSSVEAVVVDFAARAAD